MRLLQAGNAELLANWNPFVESYQKACDAVRDYLKNVGYDVPVKWVLLNDEDTSKSLLEIVDGEVIYDVAKDGKQNECSDMQYHTISTIKRTYWGRGNKDGF